MIVEDRLRDILLKLEGMAYEVRGVIETLEEERQGTIRENLEAVPAGIFGWRIVEKNPLKSGPAFTSD